MSKQEEVKERKIDLIGFQRFSLRRVRAETMQGRLFDAYDHKLNCWVVVKEAFRDLVIKKKSRNNHNVPEDILKECRIQGYLSNLPNCDEGFAKLIASWTDNDSYYHAIELCKVELFEYVRRVHQKKAQQCTQETLNTSNNEWIELVMNMFKQLVKTVSWFHQHNICHLDLSLENTMLNSEESMKLKIIDFGLAQEFNNNSFKTRGRVGKLNYMAPEVFSLNEYDARSADIWSLGVILFMLLVGAPLCEFPSKHNLAFQYIIEGNVKIILTHWNRLHLVPNDALDLMNKIFRYENERITMDELLKHPFINLISNDNLNESKEENNEENRLDLNIHDPRQNLSNNYISNQTNNNHNENQSQNHNYFQPSKFQSVQARRISQQIIDKKQTTVCLNDALEQIELELNKLNTQGTQISEHNQNETVNNKMNLASTIAELDYLKKFVKHVLDKITQQRIINHTKGLQIKKESEKTRQKKISHLQSNS